MEAAKKEEKENGSGEGKKGKGTWGSRISKFFLYGGFILVILAIVAIALVISRLTDKPLADNAVTILNPKGNDVLKGGKSYEVLWKVELAESEFGAMVTVEFSKDEGKSWEKVEENVPNKGRYMWKAPKVDSRQCKVRIFPQFRPKYSGTSGVFSVM
jgi:hypothetical protein